MLGVEIGQTLAHFEVTGKLGAPDEAMQAPLRLILDAGPILRGEGGT